MAAIVASFALASFACYHGTIPAYCTGQSDMTTQALTSGIDHVGLAVRDLNLTRDFFVECLQWKQVGEKPDYPAAFVSDGHVMLTLWQVTNQANLVAFDRKTNVGLHHLALRVGSEEALNEIFRRVSQWPGVKVEFAPENLGAGPKRHTMIYEPGGIRLEFDFDPRLKAAG
jgi:catechol 2,3-dioxygenase-like lactoylglutathione lyase family enzyme